MAEFPDPIDVTEYEDDIAAYFRPGNVANTITMFRSEEDAKKYQQQLLDAEENATLEGLEGANARINPPLDDAEHGWEPYPWAVRVGPLNGPPV